MQIYSGSTVKLYIIAVDATDYQTRETGLFPIGWSVYNSHNGGSASLQSASFTEVSSGTMAGVYYFSWTAPTISSGVDLEEGVLHITHSSGAMAPITLQYTLARPKITTGDTLSSTAPPTVQDIVDGVWDEQIVTGGHTQVGSFGYKVFDLPVESVIADAVWDELETSHNIANSYGKIIGDNIDAPISSSGGGGATAADIADAVWNELQADHVSAGTFGEIATEIASILADTNELQLNQGNWLTATGFNTVAPDNASIAAILADTNELQLNQGNWLTATGFNTVAPDNASIAAILADTNELQTNQNNWLTATGFSTHSAADAASAVWEEAVSGHNTANTFGKFLRNLKEGTISVEGSVVGTPNSTVFATDLTQTNSSFYHDKNIVFISGSLAGQTRRIESYNGTTKEITVSDAWSFAPTAGDEFLILATHEYGIAEIVDAVWTETLSDHSGVSGSTAEQLASGVGGGGGDSAADIYTHFTTGSNADAFKADLTGIATSADVAALSSGGTGLNQVTVRVQDTNANALQGAVVNIDNTVLSLVTTPTGEVVFNLDASSYTFDVSPPAGYSTPASQTLSVTGDATLVFTLSGSGTSGGSVGWVG